MIELEFFIILVISIPLASLYLSTILIHRSAFLIFLFLSLLAPDSSWSIEILGGLFQTSQLFQIPISILGGLSLIDEPYIFLLSSISIVYTNADSDKPKVLADNKGKAGIYQWKHNESGKIYIGSAFDLSKRFSLYYSKGYLEKNKSYINSAILLHGYSLFSLTILEYVDITNLSRDKARKLILGREQHFIDTISPGYNINPIANSRLGSKHTEESKELMRINNTGCKNPMFGKTHSLEYRAILSERMVNNNPKAGKPVTEEMKRIVKEFFSRPVYVYDANSKVLINKFNSRKDLIEEFKISSKTVVKYLNTGNILRERYILSNTLLDKTPESNVNQDQISNSTGNDILSPGNDT
jgi:group I intron endonuclease